MTDKLIKALEQQKLKLAELYSSRDSTKEAFKRFKKEISHIEGAIIALEFAKTLSEQQSTDDKNPTDSE